METETYLMTGTPVVAIETTPARLQEVCRRCADVPAGRGHGLDLRQRGHPLGPEQNRLPGGASLTWMATLSSTDLTKSFSGRTVVKGVNLQIASGEVVGLLGPNGAGKTTTFSMVVGLTRLIPGACSWTAST